MRFFARLMLFLCGLILPSELALAAATCVGKPAKDIVILLDVGHVAPYPGEQCPRFARCSWGATSARGVPEYSFNIKLARRIEEELVRAGFSSTHTMVTQLDGDAGLYQRVDRAKRMNADLFLSVHHDGVRDEYLKPWLYLGEQHYFYDDSSGFSLHVSPRNGSYADSLAWARMLADQLLGSGLHFTTVHQPSNPAGARKPFLDATRGIYRRNDLTVIERAEMPTVLLEAGVIVNRDEELLVATSGYQAKVATDVVEAVMRFCNPREAATLQNR
jgi:N-acetylmuramoyl-L-alanine amidase